MNLIFIIFILILFELSFGQNLSLYCDKFQDCENCTLCHEVNKDYCSCNFNNGYCIYGDGVYFSKEFLQHYDGCIKSNGNSTNACENSEIELNNGETTIQISSTFSPNVLCYYNFKYLGSNNVNMSITLQRRSIQYPKFYLYIMNYINDDIVIYTYQSFDTTDYELINIEAKKISLYIDILDPFLSEGLLLKFSIKNHLKVNDKKDSGKKKGLIIGIIIGIIALVIITIVIIILIRRRKKNKTVNKAISHSSMYSNSNVPNIEIDNTKKINEEKLNKFFQKKKTIYKKKNDIKNCDRCFSCKKYFLENSIILTTDCNHTFHLNCLKEYVSKKINRPKCPYCKSPLFGSDIENVLQKNNITSKLNVIDETNNNINVDVTI